MHITPHFTIAELSDSDTALRLGIDNTPPESVIANLHGIAEVGELIRAALSEINRHDVPIVATSGYRCEALEKVLCVKDYQAWCARRSIVPDDVAWDRYFRNKAHPQGRALDFRAPGFGSPYQIVAALSQRPEVMARIDQIIMEGTWVHVSTSDNPRGEIKTATFDANGSPTYQKGLV